MKNHKRLFLQRLCYHTLYDVWVQSLWFGDNLDVFARLQNVRKHFRWFLLIWKQKMAPNSTFWSTKTLFCVIYKTCSLWYVKITFWAQNLSKLSQKPFWDFKNYSKMFSECFWNIKEKTIFWWKKFFSKIFSTSKNLNFTIPYPSHQTLSFKATSSGHRALGKYFCNFWVLVSCLEGPN